jgi:hypothetical protein
VRVLGDEAPHPADSAASDGVRDRLVAEIRGLGLAPVVNDRFACNKLHKASGVSCARVRNVTVTIGTPASAPNLLINTHYDSVPVGPGASDAGLGVAAMLEALSIMKDRPLPRQVTFLFNEGEELGLVGARAFLDGDPLSRRVDALINLEARGTTGPVNMFETSVPNAAAVRLFKEHVRNPVANSLAVSAYRLIPNYTDVNTFVEDRDWLFLNFAPIGNETRYHSPGDDLAALDLATLQHMGDQLLEVGGALGGAATPNKASDDTLFMNIGTRWLFTFPAWPLLLPAFLIGAFLGWLTRTSAEEKRSQVRSVLPAMPLLLIILLIPVALAWAGLSAVGSLREGQFWRAHQVVTELAIYAGVIAAGLALLAAMKRWTVPQLRRAWWLLFVAIGIGFSIAAPGALVYFLIPPVVFWLGADLSRWWRHAETVGAIVAAALLYLTLGAALGLVQDLINSGPLWALALMGGLVLMPWLIEARPLMEGWRWSRVAPAALAFAALAWMPAALAPAYSADRQQQWTTQFVAERGKLPLWSIVNDRKSLPPSLTPFGPWRLQTIPALGSRQRWVSRRTSFAGGEAVSATLIPVESRNVPQGRLVRLRLVSNGANSVIVRLPAGADVRALGVPGQLRTISRLGSGPATLTCTGRSCEGAVFAMLIGKAPIPAEIIASWWGLPDTASPLLAARPQFARPQYLPDSTVTVGRVRL